MADSSPFTTSPVLRQSYGSINYPAIDPSAKTADVVVRVNSGESISGGVALYGYRNGSLTSNQFWLMMLMSSAPAPGGCTDYTYHAALAPIMAGQWVFKATVNIVSQQPSEAESSPYTFA